MPDTVLKVLVVRDGRPGHEKQSLGIVAALKEEYGVEVREIFIKPGYKAILRSLSLLVGSLPAEIAKFSPDLIVGTGSHTHFIMLALRKRLGGRTVVCMSPMKVIRNWFDLCCIPRHDEVEEGDNVLFTDGPPGLNSNKKIHDLKKGLILVGGIDEKSHIWSSEKISKTIVDAIQQHPQYQWTLTTSPRTPSDFLQVFSSFCPDKEALTLAPFSETPPGWLEKQLEVNNWVLVTEDSLSMLFEALSAGCLVATIPVTFKTENKFVRCIQDLKSRHLISSEIGDSGTQHGVELNEAKRCAKEITARFIHEKPIV
jgi:hypothetical protein